MSYRQESGRRKKFHLKYQIVKYVLLLLLMPYSKQKEDSTFITSQRESQIDVMVYYLYNPAFEKVIIIDPELNEEEFEEYIKKQQV